MLFTSNRSWSESNVVSFLVVNYHRFPVGLIRIKCCFVPRCQVSQISSVGSSKFVFSSPMYVWLGVWSEYLPGFYFFGLLAFVDFLSCLIQQATIYPARGTYSDLGSSIRVFLTIWIVGFLTRVPINSRTSLFGFLVIADFLTCVLEFRPQIFFCTNCLLFDL